MKMTVKEMYTKVGWFCVKMKMRTIIALCGIAFSLAAAGCGLDIFIPMTTTYVTITNKSSFNLRMEEYSQDTGTIEKSSIKKNETISFNITGTFSAPGPQRGDETAFYNADTNAFIKKFGKAASGHFEIEPYYILTKKEGEYASYFKPEKKWYLLEITNGMLQ